MSKKTKYTIKELAALCRYTPDALRKSKRRGYCTYRLAMRLEQVTGIPLLSWIYPSAKTDPWQRVLKGAK